MAKPGLAQEQTVEEILASIRQVINGDQPRPAPGETKSAGEAAPPPRRSATPLPPRIGNTVTALRSGTAPADEDAAAEEGLSADEGAGGDQHEAPATGGAPMHDVIELAIEEALGRLGPDDTRAETPATPAAGTRPPFGATIKSPRIEPRPMRETARIEHQPAPREAPRAEPQPTARATPRSEPPPAARETPRPAQPTPRPLPQLPSRSLLSPRTNAAVAASFDDLARVLASRDAREIDQTVEDLLRPMLKSWLEDNLPSLVERLVREEIERVSRGGR